MVIFFAVVFPGKEATTDEGVPCGAVIGPLKKSWFDLDLLHHGKFPPSVLSLGDRLTEDSLLLVLECPDKPF